MDDRTILFENDYAALSLLLTDKGLYTTSWLCKETGYRYENPDEQLALFTIPGFDPCGAEVSVQETTDDRCGLSAAAKVLYVLFTKDTQQVRVELRTYQENPFIRVSLALSGRFGGMAAAAAGTEATGIETARAEAAAEPDVLLRLPIHERHLRVRTVTLRDITDLNNTLVEESTTAVYPVRPFESRGQLFFIDAYLCREGMMIAKEAPCAAGRVADSSCDLRIEANRSITAVGLGADFSQAANYTFDTPLYAVSFAPGDRAFLERMWRACYRLDMKATLDRGLVAMSNTWGDRNQDAAVCEDFMLGEIRKARRLGVTAVQIDDGWQKGITANSKLAKSALWGSGYYDSDPDYWTPHPEKFPRGLSPVAQAAKKAGVQLGLWFSPDLARSYENWERDAQTLLGLHRQYGIRFFKLDGIRLDDKRIETNLAAMIHRVHVESRGAVTFNFDITAQRRWGYFYKREYGSLFVENRYTDFGSYYPHATLRNLWMLCRYVPTAKLQMEFLNLRRNTDRYAGDPLAPDGYSIDWAYAAVMFACPLYWMEMTNLSEADSAALSKIAAVWKSIAPDLAHADVTPVGHEPDGFAFTGLWANCGDHGYLLLFRENSPSRTHHFLIPQLRSKFFTRLAGTASVSVRDSAILFNAPAQRTFGLFYYD